MSSIALVAAQRPIIRLRPTLSSPQQQRLWTTPSKQVLFRGGIRTGKTQGACVWAITRPPGSTIIVAAPSHKSLQGGVVPTLLRILRSMEAATGTKIIVGYNSQIGEMHLADGKTFYIRSMENFELTRGITASGVLLDEGGLLKDRQPWDMLMGRLSAAKPQAICTTTPDTRGHRQWIYEVFAERAVEGVHEVIAARTQDAPWLSQSFKDGLKRDYAPAYYAVNCDGDWDVDAGLSEVYDVSKLLSGPGAPKYLRTARAWDIAATGGGGDCTAGVLMSCAEGVGLDGKPALKLYIRDVVRGQWAPAQRNTIMRATAEADGKEVRIWVPQQYSDVGKNNVAMWTQLLIGFGVSYSLETGDKVLRAQPLAAQVGADNVQLVAEAGKWENYYHEGRHLSAEAARGEFKRNLGAFPALKTRDESDAAAQALQLVLARDSGITVGKFRG